MPSWEEQGRLEQQLVSDAQGPWVRRSAGWVGGSGTTCTEQHQVYYKGAHRPSSTRTLELCERCREVAQRRGWGGVGAGGITGAGM